MSLASLLVRVLRIALTIVALVWIAAFFLDHRDDIVAAAGRYDASLVLLALACVLIGLVPGALAWARLLARDLPALPVSRGILVYLRSGIGKYTPGGVLAFAIQKKLLEEHGAPLVLIVRVFVGTALAACLAAALVGLPAAAGWAGLEHPLGIGVGVLVAIGLPTLWWRPQGWPLFPTMLSRVGVPPPLPFAATTVLMAGAWATTGAHLAVLGADTGAGATFLVSAYALSAIAGIVFAALPGALGIRDGILLLVLASRLDPAEAMLLALLSRAMIVAGDVIGTATAALLLARTRPLNQPAGTQP